jgi:hypothetical protein
MWIPAMDALGKMDHFRIFVASRKACPFSALPGGSYVDLSCPGWKHNAETFINALHPSMVVFAEKNVGKAVDPNTPSADVATFAAGVATTIRALSAPRKLVLTGVPYFNPGNSMGLDPASCLAVILSTARPLTACDTPVTRAFVATRLHADRLAATSASAINVSLTPLFCGTVNCPIVIDQQIAMSNTFHTPTWYASAVTLALRNIIGPWGL